MGAGEPPPQAATISSTNAALLKDIAAATPFLVDVCRAGDVLPGLGPRDILHAGPPLEGWHEACGSLRGAVVGTLVLKGLAKDLREAEAMVQTGVFTLRSAHELCALGTFGNVIVRDTVLLVVENRNGGARAYAALNEGRGQVLRYGSSAPESLARLAWLEGEFAAVLGAAIRISGGVDLFAVLEQALHMGDEGHSRQKAASALFLAALAPVIPGTGLAPSAICKALQFLATNDFFFLPLSMAAAKSAMANAVAPDSSLVTAIAFNGARCGIRVSGCGDQWFTSPVPSITGRYFQGYGEADAGPVIGDSEIVETMGLGAAAMAAAPALARYAGGRVDETIALTQQMYDITLAEHPRFTIPALGFRGAPFGIDVNKVLSRKVLPIFNTGIAHRMPGVGQIGAGYGRVPLACFKQAADRLAVTGQAAGAPS